MLEGDDLAQLWSGVESNKSKRCMWAPDPRSLDAVRDRTDVKGTPDSADGVLRGIRVLGAYLGDTRRGAVTNSSSASARR